jgi:hypothetical protein
MRAVGEIGLRRTAWFVWTSILLAIFRAIPFPPLRSTFLRLCGATVGAGTIVHRFTLINVDCGGFRSLRIGANCFIGHEVLIDLVASVVLEDHVTLAARAVLLTHLNVGYKDHPLMARFPSETAGVTILRGSFVGGRRSRASGVYDWAGGLHRRRRAGKPQCLAWRGGRRGAD